MDIKGYIDLSIKVLTDWRVLICTGAIFVIGALFRYVGVISRHRTRSYTRPKAPPQARPSAEVKEEG